jgi:hypothetical protein
MLVMIPCQPLNKLTTALATFASATSTLAGTNYMNLYSDVKGTAAYAWSHFVQVGNAQGRIWPGIPQDGAVVRCANFSTSTPFYQFYYSKLRLFPNASVVASWDSNYTASVSVNCFPLSNLTTEVIPYRQSTFALAKTAYSQYYTDVGSTDSWTSYTTSGSTSGRIWPGPLPDGYSAKCTPTGDANSVSLVFGSAFGSYPDPTTAASWNPQWANLVIYACTGLYNLGTLATRPQNFSAACSTYKSMYPDAPGSGVEVWNHYLSTGISQKRLWPGPPQESSSVKCTTDPSDSTSYRFSNSTIQLYANQASKLCLDPTGTPAPILCASFTNSTSAAIQATCSTSAPTASPTKAKSAISPAFAVVNIFAMFLSLLVLF